MYIDTHSHLNFKVFDLDWREVAERAHKNNIGAIINVGSNYKTSVKAIEIAEKLPFCFAAVGLHPIHVADGERSRTIKDEAFDEEKFLKLAQHKKVIAIGETGIDFYHDKSNVESQKEVFIKHLNLAVRVSKPVIIHNREAGGDLMAMLLSYGTLPRAVLHCFSEDWAYAKTILELGFFISFTGIITFSKIQPTFEVIKNAPLDRILIETDCPYLTPEPHRGDRNEPAYVIEVAKKIAEIKKLPLEKVAEQTTKNAIELFKLKISQVF